MKNGRPQAKDISDLAVLIAAARWQTKQTELGVLGLLLGLGIPAKLAIYKLERMTDRGLLEYGTSCAYVWPTDEGWSAILAAVPAGGGGT
jgi:hypothetical protein